MISIRNMRKAFDDKVLFDHFDLDIPDSADKAFFISSSLPLDNNGHVVLGGLASEIILIMSSSRLLKDKKA